MQLNILVEGQTEENFVKSVIAPYLNDYDIYAIPIVISTKIQRDGTKFKGGLTNSNFPRFIDDIHKLIKTTPHGCVTTMIDYYALPSDFPRYDERQSKNTQIEKVEFLEEALFEHVMSPSNFIPYIQLHEFETLLFASKDGFIECLDEEDDRVDLESLCKIIEENDNPEDINEGQNTSPSKRILSNYPKYDKVVEGNYILLEIGINTLLEKCPHFNSWIQKIIQFKRD